MNDLTLTCWLIILVVAFLVGVSKTGVPGVGILGVVLLVHAVGARESVGLLLPVLIVGDIFAVAWYRRHAQWRHLARLLPAAVVGILVGWALMRWVVRGNNQLGPLIGGIVLVMLALNRWRLWRGRRGGQADRPAGSSDLRHWVFAAGIGSAAGVTTMMANAAGPLLIIYLLAMRLDKHGFIGTAAWYFLLLNTFKIPFMADLGLITGGSLAINAAMLPACVAGSLAGVVLFKRIPQRAFGVIVEALAAAAALKLAAPAVVRLIAG